MISIKYINARAFYSAAVAVIVGALAIGGEPCVVEAASSTSAVRTLRAVSTNAVPGGEAVVSIELDSMGDEVALGFSVNFDPAKLNTPVITLGTGVPAGTALTINPNQSANGRIGFLLDSMNNFAMSPPARQVVSIKFSVAANAATGPSTISFGGTPVARSTSNFLGILVPTTYEDGSVTIGTPVSQTVDVGGRVVTSSGSGLRNAIVTMTDAANNRRSVPTGSMGYYSFPDVEPGRSYTITVSSRQYRFDSQPVFVGGSLTEVNFVGMN